MRRRRPQSEDGVLVPVCFRQIRVADWLDEEERARGDSFEFERYFLARRRYFAAMHQWAAEHGCTDADVIQRTRWDCPRGGPGLLHMAPRWSG